MASVSAVIQSDRAIQLVNAVLLVLGLWLVVNFVWSFWPQQDRISSGEVVQIQQSDREFNLNKVVNAEIFGSATEAPAEVQQQITAPVTRLKLKLRGVYASEDDFAAAMVEHNNKQDVYRLGAKLPGAANLTLYQVMADRIIMSRAGKYETLYIEDFDGTPRPTTVVERKPTQINAPQAGSGERSVIDKRNDARVTEEIAKLRANLEDPTAISEFISVSPVMDDGNFTGFRVAPGKNRALFGRVGLRRNDIITEVNGISMDNPAAGFTIFEQMTTADEISISLKRGNRDITLLFNAVGSP